MSNILITGGTGLVGKRLTEIILATRLTDTVTILTRDPEKYAEKERVKYAYWDVMQGQIDKSAIKNMDAVIHLAGAGIADKRWSAKRKKEILESRVKSSALLVDAIAMHGKNVKVVVSASGIAWYGEDAKGNPVPFTEEEPAAEDYLAKVCVDWERQFLPLGKIDKRVVYMRTGLVMSTQGGTLVEFLNPLKFHVAIILGNGRQVMSWIGVDDLCSMYLFALDNANVKGAVNAVAPFPVTQEELVQSLAKKIQKHSLYVRIPKWALRLTLGELSNELLKSLTVSPEKILQENFVFETPDFKTYLEATFKK